MFRNALLVFVFLSGNLAWAADDKKTASPTETDIQIHRKDFHIQVQLKNIRVSWLDLYRYRQFNASKDAKPEVMLIMDLYDRTTNLAVVGPVRMYGTKSVEIRGIFMTKVCYKDETLIDSIGNAYALHKGAAPEPAKNIAIKAMLTWKDGEMMYLTEASGRVWKRAVREEPTTKKK